MKSKAVLVLMLLLILSLSMLAHGNQQSTTPAPRQDEVEKLTAQVTQLQERVAKLEGRVDELYRWTLHPLRKG